MLIASKVYYQGSFQSTDEGIEKAFYKALENPDKERLHVLFFDEIGMAELNPKNPLKVLHKLLDETVSGTRSWSQNEPRIDSRPKKKVKRRLFDLKNFNFISISNWRLDLSKMSRSIYISRPDLTIEDLVRTSRDLIKFSLQGTSGAGSESHGRHGADTTAIIEEESRIISRAYNFFRQNRQRGAAEQGEIFSHRNFHCLRDFYWLCKDIGEIIHRGYETKEKRTEMVYEHIHVNFSGIWGKWPDKSEEAKRVKRRSNQIFVECAFEQNRAGRGRRNGRVRTRQRIIKDLSEKKEELTKIIRHSVETRGKRFLLLFVENNFCTKMVKDQVRGLLRAKGRRLVHIMGSRLNFDVMSPQYNLDIIKSLKLYIEMGYTLMLENLDPIYTLLYDLFNQNYEHENGKQMCRITLEDTEHKLPIHPDFKCILVKSLKEVETDQNIEIRLPSPLMNRLEKHIVKYKDIKQKELENELIPVQNHLINLLHFAKKKRTFKVTLNDLIFCFNDGELLQKLQLQIKDQESSSPGRPPLSKQEMADELKDQVIAFYTFKMLVLHCMSLGEDEQEARRVKDKYLETHPFLNLRKYVKQRRRELKERVRSKKSAGGAQAQVRKSVVMTSTNFFSLNREHLRG